jgi:hypothetical protein
MALSACSGAGTNNCVSACEPGRVSGPQIDITPEGASIAAIETLAARWTSDTSNIGSGGYLGDRALKYP